jgi:hypothetical protein
MEPLMNVLSESDIDAIRKKVISDYKTHKNKIRNTKTYKFFIHESELKDIFNSQGCEKDADRP